MPHTDAKLQETADRLFRGMLGNVDCADAFAYGAESYRKYESHKAQDARTRVFRDAMVYGLGITRIHPSDFLKGNTMELSNAIDLACRALGSSTSAHVASSTQRGEAINVLREIERSPLLWAQSFNRTTFDPSKPVRCVNDVRPVTIVTTGLRGRWRVLGYLGDTDTLYYWDAAGRSSTCPTQDLVNIDPRDELVKVAREYVKDWVPQTASLPVRLQEAVKACDGF